MKRFLAFASALVLLTSCGIDSSTTSSDTTISTESNATEDDTNNSGGTSEPNSPIYDRSYALMESLYSSPDSPFTDYWINQQNGGKVSYCDLFEKAAEQDAGVTLDAIQTQDWVNACIDFLTSKGF